MKKKSKCTTFLLATLMMVCSVGVCSVGFSANMISVAKETRANNLYTLTVNQISNARNNFVTGIYPVTTEEGNTITITCSGAKIETYDGQDYNTLLVGKNFGNKESLGSINQIIFNNVLNETTINLEYGWNRSDGVKYPHYDVFTVTSGKKCVIDVTGYKPNYFNIVANTSFSFQSCDITYECMESETHYGVRCASIDTTMGTTTGSGLYKYDDTVTLTATPAPYTGVATIDAPYSAHKFEGWYENSTCISTNNPYTFKMTRQDRTIYAKFTYEPLKTNNIIYHGHYPQSRETTTSIINQCNQKADYYPTASDKRLWTPYNWYLSSSNSTKFGWYIDVDLNNDGVNDYRGVYFTTYRPKTSTSAETTTSNQYINGYRTSTVYWFKYEPIAWRVLENANGNHLVMANKVLDAHYYNAVEGGVTRRDYNGNQATCAQPVYQYSDLRTFLNLDFYKAAFNTTENSKISTTTVDNSAYSTGNSSNSYASSDTSDKMFALSTREITNKNYGFANLISTKDQARVLYPTDYALCMGAYKSTSSQTPVNSSYYWMRSPYGNNNNETYYMQFTGAIYHMDTTYVSGIVPAMHLVA